LKNRITELENERGHNEKVKKSGNDRMAMLQ
jgi:hypothetical protein